MTDRPLTTKTVTLTRERAIGLRIGLIRAVEIFSIEGRHALYDAGERAQKDLIECGVTGTDADATALKALLTPEQPDEPHESDLYRLLVTRGYSQHEAHQIAEGPLANTDSQRLDWYEASHTLHQSIESLYVVDGFQIEMQIDGNEGPTFHGQDMRDAIDQAMRNLRQSETKVGKPDHACEPELIVQPVEMLPALGHDPGHRVFVPGPRYVRCRVCHRPMDEQPENGGANRNV